MISKQDNEIRNNVMRKVKFEQIKRQKLRNFMREAKANVIRDRGPLDNDTQINSTVTSPETIKKGQILN